MNNVGDRRNRTKDAFSEKDMCYETANASQTSGRLKTKIVVSLPSAQRPAAERVDGVAPAGAVRRFLEAPRNLLVVNDGTSRNLSLLAPGLNTPNETPDPEASIAKRPQRIADAEGAGGGGGIKVRKKESKRLGKAASLTKRKRLGRGRKRPAFFREETEFPLGDYDSVESLMTMDGVQTDSPGSGGGHDGTPMAADRESFLPRLSAGQRLPNLTEDPSSAAPAEAASLAETDSATHRQERDADGRTPIASLPAITKSSTRRQRPIVKERSRRQRKKCDNGEGKSDRTPSDAKPEAARKPETRKEEVDLGDRKILVDENSLSLSTVIRFSDPPKPQPLTLAFEYPKNYLTHRYVLDMVKNQIHAVPYGYVTALQFQDCNVRKSAEGLLNRWLVTVSCPEARDQLLRMGIKLFNRKTNLRRYDDILNEEFKQFNAWIKSVKKVLGSGDCDLLAPEGSRRKADDDSSGEHSDTGKSAR